MTTSTARPGAYDAYQALIFDMDGTLVDSGRLHELAWRATLERFAIPVDVPLMRSLAGVPTRATLERLLAHFGCAATASLDEMIAFKEGRVRRDAPLHVRPTALVDVVRQYLGHDGRARKPMAVGTGASTEEAHATLRTCGFDARAMGLRPLALPRSVARPTPLRSVSLDAVFDVVVGADQVDAPKPAPDTFLLCARRLGVAPEACVVFEDSPMGLEAARRAGMTAVDVLAVHGVVNDYFLG